MLAALPMLLREGLLKRAQEFLELPKGYYGVTSMLVLLTFLLLGRVRNTEALRHQAPGEWGGSAGTGRLSGGEYPAGQRCAACPGWLAALAQDWLADDPEVPTILAVDGHVKVYASRKRCLPKHFVARQKLCMPATTGYWINALGRLPHQHGDGVGPRAGRPV